MEFRGGNGRLGDATSKLLRGLLELFVLDSIAREPKHGYALIRELEQAFGEPPNRNQVYPLLNRLEKDGYLRADRSEGRGRTRYALTGKGLELLKDYRVRTPLFLQRIAALWQLEAPGVASGAEVASGPPGAPSPPAPSPPPARPPGPHLLDQLALEGEAPPRPSPGAAQAPPAAHAGAACEAELVLRRRPGADRVVLEFASLDPACPACRELLGLLQGLKDRWF